MAEEPHISWVSPGVRSVEIPMLILAPLQDVEAGGNRRPTHVDFLFILFDHADFP